MTPLEKKQKMLEEFRKRKEVKRELHNYYSVLLYNKYDGGKINYERLIYLIEILNRWEMYA